MIRRWRPVVGYEGLYEVSDQGRVRSLPKRVAHWLGGTRLRRGRIRKLTVDRDGYARLMLGADRKSYRVCRLVTAAFQGPAPSALHEAAHLNGNRADDSAQNLRWKTPKANAADRELHGTTARGERIGKATQCSGSVERIRDLSASGCRQVDIAAWIGLSQSQVSAIIRRQFWRHV